MPRVQRARAWESIYSFLHEDKVMEKHAAKKILEIVTLFYILVSVLAVAILSLSGSIFAKRGETNLTEYFQGIFGDEDNAAEEAVNDIPPEDKLQGMDALNSSATEPEPMVETEPEPVPEPEPEPEPLPEPEDTVSEDSVSENEAEEEHYYSFKSNNTDTRLRMRAEPDEKAKVVYELKPGTTGYVIELGDEWSNVCAYGNKGYCANEFLTMTEISKEEYDELVTKTDAEKQKKDSTDTAAAAPAVDPALLLNAAGTTDAAPAAATDAAAQTAGTPEAAPSEDP